MSERSDRRSLIYDVPGGEHCVFTLEAWPNPNWYVGREVEIYYGGIDGTETTGIAALVEKRVIAAVPGDGKIVLNAPLQYDLIPEDVSEILAK